MTNILFCMTDFDLVSKGPSFSDLDLQELDMCFHWRSFTKMLVLDQILQDLDFSYILWDQDLCFDPPGHRSWLISYMK